MFYTIQDLINNCDGKNYLELLKYLDSECKSIEVTISNLKRHHNISEYKLREYQNYAKGFLFFLNTGSIPMSISKNDFKVFKPIVEQLVADGMNASALDNFQ